MVDFNSVGFDGSLVFKGELSDGDFNLELPFVSDDINI
jgi:hypothetical protein